MDLSGSHFALWSPSPDLVGFSLWGSPTPQDIAELGLALQSREGGYRALIDLALLEAIDPSTFEALVGFTRRHRSRLRESMVRVALVRSAGMIGTIATTFLEVARNPQPLQTFSALEPAAGWLGAPTGWALELQTERDTLAGRNPLLSRLRQIFQQLGPGSTASADVARRLAVSQRTLVRRLSELGTSFQKELSQYRIDTAQKLMRDTDAPLGAIAEEAGFGSVQRFCTAFRHATGQTPATWRFAASK